MDEMIDKEGKGMAGTTFLGWYIFHTVYFMNTRGSTLHIGIPSPFPELWNCLCKLFIQLPHILVMAYFHNRTYNNFGLIRFQASLESGNC